MDARAASASLTLTNSGKRAESYRVELVDMLYQDDGRVVPAEKVPADYPSAKNLIRFSPSQIRLEPGESQTVRVLVKTQDKLPDGEYRVHAALRQLPNVADMKEPAKKAGTVAGVIGIEQSVAIAVIVRRGQTAATGSIASMKLVEGGKTPALDLQLGRNGNRSLYTNLLLKDSSGKLATEVKGVAVPVPNERRRFVWSLDAGLIGKVKAGGYTLEMVDHDTGNVIDKKPVK